MPRTKAGRLLLGWRFLAAMAVAPALIPSASAKVFGQDLLPPASAKAGEGKPAAPVEPIPDKPPELPGKPDPDAPPAFRPEPVAPAPTPTPVEPPANPHMPIQHAPATTPTPSPAATPVQRTQIGGARPLGRMTENEPTRDPQAVPAQNPVPGGDPANPLPPAVEAKPGAGGAATAKPVEPGASTPDGFRLSNDRLPVGRQAVGLSIEVVAPPVMNINHVATLKLVVRNTGTTDVATVRARYDLPKELTLVSSQPQAERATPDDPALRFMLNTIAAGSDRIITLKVKAKEVASIDHVAHVEVLIGSRAPSVIQEPKLRVEMPNPTPSKVLKGEQVQFRIAVKNVGNGPARDVEVAAKFSSGLKADDNDLVGQTIPVIQPGDTVTLDPLLVDTFLGGEQTCKVVVSSPDVAASPNDMTVTRSVFVTKPDLALKLEGPPKRYTDTLADYRMVVENPGTAPAKNVTVTAVLPASGGRLVQLPPGADWNRTTRRLQWTIANLDPGEKNEMSFQVRLGGMGLYQVSAFARAADLGDKGTFTTDVSGFPDVTMILTEQKRVLDVGEFTVFDVTIQNKGTREARNLKLSALLSKNLSATVVRGDELDPDVEVLSNDATGEVRFPTIERLATGRTLTFSIKAEAKAAGVGTCKVFLEHEDLPGTKIEDFAHTTIAGGAEVRTK